MFKGKWIGLLIFVLIFLLMPAGLWAERMTGNWRLTGYTRYRDAVFADVDRLNSPAPGVTTVWVKIAPSAKSPHRRFINEYLQSVKKNHKKFISIEILCEIHCSRDLIRFLRFAYLENDGSTLHNASEINPAYYRIELGSVWHPVKKEICKTP